MVEKTNNQSGVCEINAHPARCKQKEVDTPAPQFQCCKKRAFISQLDSIHKRVTARNIEIGGCRGSGGAYLKMGVYFANTGRPSMPNLCPLSVAGFIHRMSTRTGYSLNGEPFIERPSYKGHQSKPFNGEPLVESLSKRALHRKPLIGSP